MREDDMPDRPIPVDGVSDGSPPRTDDEPVHIGHKADRLAVKLVPHIESRLPSGERIEALFKVSSLRPILDFIVVTNLRLGAGIAPEHGILKIDLPGKSITSAANRKSKMSRVGKISAECRDGSHIELGMLLSANDVGPFEKAVARLIAGAPDHDPPAWTTPEPPSNVAASPANPVVKPAKKVAEVGDRPRASKAGVALYQDRISYRGETQPLAGVRATVRESHTENYGWREIYITITGPDFEWTANTMSATGSRASSAFASQVNSAARAFESATGFSTKRESADVTFTFRITSPDGHQMVCDLTPDAAKQMVDQGFNAELLGRET